MALEQQVKEEQLEFPFLEKMRKQLYAVAQYEDMRSKYQSIQVDWPAQKPDFNYFVQFYAKSGLAAEFRARNHEKYFYDSVEHK